MNRILAIVLAAVAIIAALIIALLAKGAATTPDAVQTMADYYAGFVSRSTPQLVTVERIVRAARPERFEQALSKATYADSVYYRTAHSLRQSTIIGVRPVPYPPKSLWCVQLSDGGVIVVGQHHDLYNADWVLHEVVDADSTPARVGCALK